MLTPATTSSATFFGKRPHTPDISTIISMSDVSAAPALPAIMPADRVGEYPSEPPPKVRRTDVAIQQATMDKYLWQGILAISPDMLNKLIRKIFDPIIEAVSDGAIDLHSEYTGFIVPAENAEDYIPGENIRIIVGDIEVDNCKEMYEICKVLNTNREYQPLAGLGIPKFTDCAYDDKRKCLKFAIDTIFFQELILITPSIIFPILEKIIVIKCQPIAKSDDISGIINIKQKLQKFLMSFYCSGRDENEKDVVKLLQDFLRDITAPISIQDIAQYKDSIQNTMRKLDAGITAIAEGISAVKERMHGSEYSLIGSGASAIDGIEDFLKKEVKWSPKDINDFVVIIDAFLLSPESFLSSEGKELVIKALKEDLSHDPSKSFSDTCTAFKELQEVIKFSLSPQVISTAEIEKLLDSKIIDDGITKIEISNLAQNISVFRDERSLLTEEEKEEVIDVFVSELKKYKRLFSSEVIQIFGELKEARLKYKQEVELKTHGLLSENPTIFAKSETKTEQKSVEWTLEKIEALLKQKIDGWSLQDMDTLMSCIKDFKSKQESVLGDDAKENVMQIFMHEIQKTNDKQLFADVYKTFVAVKENAEQVFLQHLQYQ